jgi:hypothetical protein
VWSALGLAEARRVGNMIDWLIERRRLRPNKRDESNSEFFHLKVQFNQKFRE